MNYSNRKTAAWVLVLFVLVAAGVSAGNAQTESAYEGHWLNCAGSWLIGDHGSGPNFTVKVTFRGQPISGVKVVLTGESADPTQNPGGLIATDHTDSNGVAHFFAIPPGTYQPHVDQALLASSKQIEVKADSSSSEEVQIEWPSAPITTRSARGWIRSGQKSSPQNRSEMLPHKNVLIQLLDLRAGKMLASQYTNAEGYYEFSVARDGLYALRVNEHPDPSINSYDQAVEVAGDALLEHIPDLEVSRICGQGLVQLQDEADREKSPVH